MLDQYTLRRLHNKCYLGGRDATFVQKDALLALVNLGFSRLEEMARIQRIEEKAVALMAAERDRIAQAKRKQKMGVRR